MTAKRHLSLFLLCALLSFKTFSMERIGRLGIGYSQQIKNDLPAVSFKLQKSRSFSFGGLFSMNSGPTGGWGAGLKLYKNIFDEPQANFYASMLGALTNKKTEDEGDKTGFQIDLTVGSEFSFTGLQSIGFSIETGVSFNKINDFQVETVGDNFLVAGVHFYL